MLFNEYATRLNWLITIPAIIMILISDFNWLVAFLLFGVLIIIYHNEPTDEVSLSIDRIVKGKNFKEGDHVTVKLDVHNESDYPFHGEVIDILPEHASVWEGSNINLMHIPPNSSQEMKFEILFERRGKYTIGPIEIRQVTQGMILENREEIETYKEVVIVPQPEKVTTYSLPPAFLTSMGGLFRSKLVGDGLDFSGVREYRLGDPMRRVNWKVTAKYNELHSNEFEVNRATRIIIALDLTEESIEIADASVRAALGLAEYLLNNRTKVGILTMGEYISYIPAKSGRRHLMEITQHLTNVDAITKIKERSLFKSRLDQTIERVGEKAHEVLLFSSLNRPENADILSEKLPQLGNLTVLAPTAVYMPKESNELLNLSKRILDLRKLVIKMNLAERGIKIFEWTPELPFDTSVSSWRMRQ